MAAIGCRIERNIRRNALAVRISACKRRPLRRQTACRLNSLLHLRLLTPHEFRLTALIILQMALDGREAGQGTPSGKNNLYVFSLVVNDGKDNSKPSLALVVASKKGDLTERDVGGSVYSNPFGR